MISNHVFMVSIGLRIAPGVRLSASGSGLSASVGPRVARVHAGPGGAAVSSGLGPLTVSSRVGGRASGGKKAPKTTRAESNDPSIFETADNVIRTVGMTMSLLEGGAKIVQWKRTRDAARAASLAQQDAEQQLCESHWIEFLPAVPTHFPLPSPGLKGRLTPAGKQQHSDALREHAAQQAACDEEWRLLNEHEPACVIDGINEAFSDNATPSICIDAGQDAGTRYATLVVTFPHPDFIAREVWGTSGDLKSRSDRNVADVYRRMVSSVVVATTKEAFATAPACEEARIVVVRWDTRALSNTPRLGVIYSGTFDRSVLTTDWSTTTPRRLIGETVDARIDDPAGKPLRALSLRKHPDLQVLVSEIENELTAPTPG